MKMMPRKPKLRFGLEEPGIPQILLDLRTGLTEQLPPIYESDSKSKGKIYLMGAIQVTVSNFTYYFSK
jgi:hypothetical protein